MGHPDVPRELISPRGCEIRAYRGEDARATLAVFLDAVMTTASRDYSAEQVAAWGRPEQRNEAEWDRSLTARSSCVAIVGGEIAGFSDVSDAGYIDMLFVSPRHGRQGVATALLAYVEAQALAAGIAELSADVSITARPVFERAGFAVEAEQHPMRGGVVMTNFRMTKRVGAASPAP